MDNKILKATDEDKHVQKIIEVEGKKYRLTPKYMEWEKCYWDKSNKECYLNATRSAIEAYNLDPIGQYGVAEQIGFENVRKHKTLARRYWRGKGKTEGELLDIYYNMMLARKDPNMLYAIAEVMGVELPDYKPLTAPAYVINQTTNNQVNVGGDIAISFIEEEVVDASNSEA